MAVQRLITMSRLGTYGQWGNQCFQYAFLRTYARRHGLEYQVPKWAGQYFFGHEDPPITTALPEKAERYEPTKHESCFGVPIPPDGEEYAGHDFRGWAQYNLSWYAPDRPFIQGLFEPVVSPESERVLPALDRLRSIGDTVIGLHLRRGDAGRMIFFLLPMAWCLKWLHEHWQRFERPVLFIATEDPSLVRWFRHYNPVLAEDLGLGFSGAPPQYEYPHPRDEAHVRSMDFFADWFLLQQADVVLGGETTYSFTAAWLSRQNQEYWRARLSTGRFEKENPWDCPASHREHLNDYPGVPGTQWDENLNYSEYWGDYQPAHESIAETPEQIVKWMKPC